MHRTYLQIGWRILVRQKAYSLINIGGLALGIAVSLLIGLWVRDELSFNKDQKNYHNFAAVLQNTTIDGVVETWSSQSYQLGSELRTNYGSYFKSVAMCSFPTKSIIKAGEKLQSITGCFTEADGPKVLSLQMVNGSLTALTDKTSILLSTSVAKNIFGDDVAVGKTLRLDDDIDLKVAGIYEDIPTNSSFHGELGFIAPLDILVDRGGRNFGWVNSWLQVFVELADQVDMQQASIAIKDAKLKNVSESDKAFKPELFLFPLSKWHLYSRFENGVNTGGKIEYVWLFGLVGAVVLLLACINFMNLTTARSQQRSKEVGVRKVVGSTRSHLVRQFFMESLLVVSLAFVLAIVLAQVSLPLFNQIAGKTMTIDWSDLQMWSVLIMSVFAIAVISGSYPAFYLSAFKPVKVLKGNFKIGRNSSLPRKALVVIQFAVSVTLIIGSIVIYQQVQFATNRPVGYDNKGLITIPIKTDEVKRNVSVLRNELISSGAFTALSTSETTVTNMWYSDWAFDWRGKDPNVHDYVFYRGAIDYEFGKTVGWTIKQGRDFSKEFASDSSGMILNEAAVRFMRLEDPIGETVYAYGKNYQVIGVVKDMISQSLYEPAKPTIFVIDPFDQASFVNVKISPAWSTRDAIQQLQASFAKHNPNTPFEYRFADDEFSQKFDFEKRIGILVAIFTLLAIFISCLGLFGLASFVAEQRTKEIGIRKVLGASVPRLWRLLSGDFVVLVTISCLIALPAGYYLVSGWLDAYDYRTPIHWWVFAGTCVAAILITLATVSVQAIKAALLNPAYSLKSE